MLYTESEIMEFISDNDIKFIRLAFCDFFGIQKNVSIMPSELAKAIKYGLAIDATQIVGFGSEQHSELLLKPDLATIALLPWRPSHGRVIRLFCNICYPDGTPFEGDSRRILKEAVDSAAKAGLDLSFGSECEFYLFKTDDDGEPTSMPLDHAGYMDIAPDDKGENVRREICLTLEEMEIIPERSHHEDGPGQNEIDFRPASPLQSADNLTTFKSVVKAISARNGLWATFAPKPLSEAPGSGMHISVSFISHQDFAESFMAGILEYVCDMTAFLNPSSDSFCRLGSMTAPRYISWSQHNCSQLIRLYTTEGGRRIELRSPDALANPYIAYALLIYAGLEGLKRNLVPQESIDRPITEDLRLKRLPDNYEQALKVAQESRFIGEHIPPRILAAYAHPSDSVPL